MSTGPAEAQSPSSDGADMPTAAVVIFLEVADELKKWATILSTTLDMNTKFDTGR